ncbi:MAG: sarcosine oxidase subunit gamma [Planktotalea sp.]|uniref:sarcosine oxidase subunit gamma n=1 Tax=Planktotalea sp. TaxID=2029877 RepID=UPI003C71CCF3
MADLLEISPAEGLLPYATGAAELNELALGRATSIAPFKGQESAVEKALGVSLPDVGRSNGKAGQEIVWFSQGQFLALGLDVPDTLSKLAAVTDQSDAWCALELKGDASVDVLARLVPLDLRQSVFKRGHCARTQLGHLPLHITRTGNASFRMLSFRSMAGTMVHEITRAMDLFDARG